MNRAPFDILAVLAALSLLAACGAEGDEAVATEPAPTAQATAAAPPPLFDDIGRPKLATAAQVPLDTAARTRSGLYASRAQLAWQEVLSAPTTVVLDLDDLGSPEAAVTLAQAVRGYRLAPDGLSYFVRGGTPVAAAEVANRLADDGVAPVFVVH